MFFPNQKILGINCSKGRGFILPGGKWEHGESFKRCATRELYEETGLIANKATFLHVGPSTDGYMCHAFLCEVTNWENLSDRGEGAPTDLEWDDLIEGGAFGAYYEVLRDVYYSRMKC